MSGYRWISGGFTGESAEPPTDPGDIATALYYMGLALGRSTREAAVGARCWESTGRPDDGGAAGVPVPVG